ncbi:MAG: hypothetical protein M0P23_05220, partial [Bacteroidales bacterium]|nr:hypothetical protein [Bacteroidales bacterium]
MPRLTSKRGDQAQQLTHIVLNCGLEKLPLTHRGVGTFGIDVAGRTHTARVSSPWIFMDNGGIEGRIPNMNFSAVGFAFCDVAGQGSNMLRQQPYRMTRTLVFPRWAVLELRAKS